MTFRLPRPLHTRPKQPFTRIFKRSLFRHFDINNLYDFAIDRFSSIIQTRLCLGCCGLNYYLFKINCLSSTMCVCNMEHESVVHYLLKCRRYAASRLTLLSSAEQFFGFEWHLLSDSQKVNIKIQGD
jgi:hypothetical protein